MKIGNLYLYSVFALSLFFNVNFNTLTATEINDIEEIVKKQTIKYMTIEDIKKDLRTHQVDEEIVSNVVQGPKKYLFCTKDSTGHQWMIKIEGGIDNAQPRIREFLSYEIAKLAKIDDVVVPMLLIGHNKILLSKFAYFLPENNQYKAIEAAIKKSYPTLDKDLSKITAKISEAGNDGINIEKISKSLNWEKEDSYNNIDPASYQKSLIFTFLTFQQDANYSNILYTVIGDHDKPSLKPINFDFVFSMTEDNVGKIISENPYIYQEAHLRNDYDFKISQNQTVEAEIIEIVKILKYENFIEILDKHQLDEQDRFTFESRINDLKKAFSENVSSFTIGEIMKPLFEKHEEKIQTEKNNH